jgi:hypothetical protein
MWVSRRAINFMLRFIDTVEKVDLSTNLAGILAKILRALLLCDKNTTQSTINLGNKILLKQNLYFIKDTEG